MGGQGINWLVDTDDKDGLRASLNVDSLNLLKYEFAFFFFSFSVFFFFFCYMGTHVFLAALQVSMLQLILDTFMYTVLIFPVFLLVQ